MTRYEEYVNSKSKLRWILGCIMRLRTYLRYQNRVRLARKRGALIGESVVIPMELAKRACSNLSIGNYTSIQSSNIDLRNKVIIGSHVIIGGGNQIITTSHNIDSPDWEPKHYGIEIEDYVWISTNCLIMPSCRKIGRGAVIGAGSVVVRDVPPMAVMSGNPAKEMRKRKCIHSDLIVEGLLGGDFKTFKDSRRK